MNTNTKLVVGGLSRVIATYRNESDPCESGTPGCCIDHYVEDVLQDGTAGGHGSCETW